MLLLEFYFYKSQSYKPKSWDKKQEILIDNFSHFFAQCENLSNSTRDSRSFICTYIGSKILKKNVHMDNNIRNDHIKRVQT